MSEVLLQLKNFSHTDPKHGDISDVSFSIFEEQIATLVGPSDSRMATLLSLITLECQKGCDSQTLPICSNQLGLVSEHTDFFDHLSVFENMSLAMRFVGVRSHTHLGETIERALRQVRFWQQEKELLHRPVKNLTPLQKAKVNLARSLIFEPQVLFLQDPTQLLGPLQVIEYEKIIEDLKSEMAVLWRTSDLEQAARVSDRVIFMYQGRVIETGAAEEVFTTPTSEITEQFITRRLYAL